MPSANHDSEQSIFKSSLVKRNNHNLPTRRDVLEFIPKLFLAQLVLSCPSFGTAYADEPSQWNVKPIVTENNPIVSEGSQENGKTKISPIAAILLGAEEPFQLRFRMTVEPLNGTAPEKAAGGLMVAANDLTEGPGINRLLISRYQERWWMAQDQGQGTAQTGKPITRELVSLPEVILSLSSGRTEADIDVHELPKIMRGYQMRQPLVPNNPEGFLLVAAISTRGTITTVKSLDLLTKQ